MEEYNTTKKQTSIQKIDKELEEVKSILSEEFEMMVDRDRNLSNIGKKAADLKNKSSEFKSKSTQVKWQMMFRNYMIIAIAVAIIAAIAYFALHELGNALTNPSE